jgi:hypothetical protein
MAPCGLLPEGFSVRHDGLDIVLAVSPGLAYRFTADEARTLARHLEDPEEAAGQPSVAQRFDVRCEGGIVILAASTWLEYQFTAPQARAIAWRLTSEIAAARRTRHLAARGD